MANILKPRSPFKTLSKLAGVGKKYKPTAAEAKHATTVGRGATRRPIASARAEGGMPASRKPMQTATPMPKPSPSPRVKPKPRPKPRYGKG